MRSMQTCQREAAELVRLLAQDPKRPSEQADWVNKHFVKSKRSWREIQEFWTFHLQHNRNLDDYPYAKGVAHFHLGASYYCAQTWQKALNHFRAAEDMFGFDNDRYRIALARMAQGLAYTALGDVGKALASFQDSDKQFSDFADRLRLSKDHCGAERCHALSWVASNLMDRLIPTYCAPNLVFLIPTDGCCNSGKLRIYLSIGCEAEALVIGGKLHQMRCIQKRSAFRYPFSPEESYLLVTTWDSNLTQWSTHLSERLLVKHQDKLVGQPGLVAVHDAEGSSMTFVVEDCKEDSGYTYLNSTNPVTQRAFTNRSHQVEVLGSILAIASESPAES